MIWIIAFLCLSVTGLLWYIVRLVEKQAEQAQRLDDLTKAHNWTVREMEHRAEQTQETEAVKL